MYILDLNLHVCILQVYEMNSQNEIHFSVLSPQQLNTVCLYLCSERHRRCRSHLIHVGPPSLLYFTLQVNIIFMENSM